MSKFYVRIGGRNHITRTNLAGCQTECGLELVKGMDLSQLAPEHLCKRCEESAVPGTGPMSLPHYLESQNAELRQLIEDAALNLEANNLYRSAETLREKLHEKLHEVTCNER